MSDAAASSDSLALQKLNQIEELLDDQDNYTPDKLDDWFTTLKQIITAADLHRTNNNQKRDQSENDSTKTENGDSIYADYIDDNEQFNASNQIDQFATNPVKWTIRVRAFKLVHRLAPSFKIKYLVDLIRLSFVSATSPYDDLKMQGFQMFIFIINRFAQIEEREFPGHSILEQYATQVIFALKPAFDLEAPPYITAIASRACSLWICYSVQKEGLGLKRPYQLMVSTIKKLEQQSTNHNIKLYTERELELERLDILGSWAQLYIHSKEFSVDQQEIVNESKCELHSLVQPQIGDIVGKWWEALKDFALLIIPKSHNHSPKLSTSLSSPDNINCNQIARLKEYSLDDQQVYTREVALNLYAATWHELLLATTYWLCSSYKLPKAVDGKQETKCDIDLKKKMDDREKYFKFICGLIMKQLCDQDRGYVSHSNNAFVYPELGGVKTSLNTSTIVCLKSLLLLVSDYQFNEFLVRDLVLTREFYSIIYRIHCHQMSSKVKMNDDKLLLSQCMSSLFDIFIKSLIDNEEHEKLEGTINTLSSKLAIYVNEINTQPCDNQNAIIKARIVITSRNLIATMGHCARFIDHSIAKQVTDNLSNVLMNQSDISIRITLLSNLTSLASNVLHDMNKNLLDAKLNGLSNHISNLTNIESITNINLIECRANLDATINSIRTDLNLSEDEDYRNQVVEKLIICFEKIEVDVSKMKELNKEIAKLDQFAERIRSHLINLKRDFDASFRSIQNQKPDIAKIFQELIESKNSQPKDTGHNVKSKNKEPEDSQLLKGKTKPRKIVLKKDFGNFYNTKK